MPIVVRKKETPTPKSKKQAFKEYKKKEGHHHKADPNHPMNAEGPPKVKRAPYPPSAVKGKHRKPNPEKGKKRPEKGKKTPDRKYSVPKKKVGAIGEMGMRMGTRPMTPEYAKKVQDKYKKSGKPMPKRLGERVRRHLKK